MRAWRPLGLLWAPCGPKVAARSASNHSWWWPGGVPEAKKIFGTGPGSVLARKADREEPPGDALGLIQGVPEVAGDQFWRSFLTVMLKSSFH